MVRRALVWVSTLVCLLFIGTGAWAAPAPTACPATINGALTGSSPTQAGNRVFRDGVPSTCGSAKGFPGTLAPSGARAYDVYHFTNSLPASACYTFAITTSSGSCQMVAYSSYAANAATNWIADTGNSTSSESMSLTIGTGVSFDVAVVAFTPGGTATYTMTVSGCSAAASVSAAITGPNPSVFGQTAAFSASVSGNSGTPTGTVDFMDGATNLGTVALDATGNAALTTPSLGVGMHSITAVYSGDVNYATGTSSAVSQEVDQAATTTALASSQNPQNVGQSVTFTATVAPVLPGDGTPTGTVSFFDGATLLGTGALAAGQATYATSSLAVGSHDITAVYAGDTNFSGSTSPILSESIDPAAATVSVTGMPSTTTYGAPVQFDATVSASTGGTPTGTITFKDGTSQLSVVALTSGTASFTTSALLVGTHTIVAEYSGDVNHNAATGSTAQTVNLAPSSSALVSLANPSVSGQSVTFTGTVIGNVGTPTGTLTMFDGMAMLGSAALDSGGNATFTMATLAVGTHPLTVVYSGDSFYDVSTSPVLNQVVNKSGTSVTITASQNPQAVGVVVTFGTTVSASLPGMGTATGTVSFYDNTGSRHLVGTAPLTNGQATLDVSTLTVGSHAMTVDYPGDGNFTAASSPSLFEIIDPLASGIALTTMPSPSRFAESVQIQATVAPGTGGTPTGMITFSDGATGLGSVALDGSGMASLSLSTLAVGSHTISAAYAGDSNHNAANASVTHVVNKAATTTVLASSANPSVFGQTTTLTATVTSAAGTPAGTVVFKEGTTTYGTVTLDGSGVAHLDVSNLSVGDHVISAAYSGSANLDTSSTAEPTQVVTKAATTVSITSSSNPTIVGTPATFTATIQVVAPGAGAPSGNVQFKEGTTVLGTGTVASGTASFSTSTLAVGTHDITAVYAGDDSFLTSTSSALTQTVQAAGVTIALSVNPSSTVYGQDAMLTAIASSTTGGTPTGTITFAEGATTLGMGTLAAGSATFAIGTLDVGAHSLKATYSGDGNHPAGANATAVLAVTKRGTKTTLTSSVNPSTAGQSTTLTATVTIESLGGDAGGPTSGLTPLAGSVTFSDGQTDLGTSTITNGVATLAVSSLTLGSHALSAEYRGAANYDQSASAALVQIVTGGSDGGVVDGGGGGMPDASIDRDAGGGGMMDASVDTSNPMPDAGTTTDAGNRPDSGTTTDARVADGGTAMDAALADATSTDAARTDAGNKVDASTPPGDDSGGGGCGCRMTPSSSSGGLYALGLALGLAAVRRRRKR